MEGIVKVKCSVCGSEFAIDESNIADGDVYYLKCSKCGASFQRRKPDTGEHIPVEPKHLTVKEKRLRICRIFQILCLIPWVFPLLEIGNSNASFLGKHIDGISAAFLFIMALFPLYMISIVGFVVATVSVIRIKSDHIADESDKWINPVIITAKVMLAAILCFIIVNLIWYIATRPHVGTWKQNYISSLNETVHSEYGDNITCENLDSVGAYSIAFELVYDDGRRFRGVYDCFQGEYSSESGLTTTVNSQDVTEDLFTLLPLNRNSIQRYDISFGESFEGVDSYIGYDEHTMQDVLKRCPVNIDIEYQGDIPDDRDAYMSLEILCDRSIYEPFIISIYNSVDDKNVTVHNDTGTREYVVVSD